MRGAGASRACRGVDACLCRARDATSARDGRNSSFRAGARLSSADPRR